MGIAGSVYLFLLLMASLLIPFAAGIYLKNINERFRVSAIADAITGVLALLVLLLPAFVSMPKLFTGYVEPYLLAFLLGLLLTEPGGEKTIELVATETEDKSPPSEGT